MKNSLKVVFSFILICMLIVTTWASLQENVISGGAKLFEQPWGIATLADTYFAFITFYLWVFYKEVSTMRRLVWLILVLLLGNIAMAAYVLFQIQRAKADTFEAIFLRQHKSI